MAFRRILYNVPMPASPIALYIHIPFCETKCNYCNFNTYARLGHLVQPYIAALGAELRAWGKRLGHPEVRTVFFGGGTPSWLPVEGLASILDAARDAFPFQANPEVTVEANPGDVVDDKLTAWCSMGINRVSMGVQTFDDQLLTLLTRRHTAAQAIDAYRRIEQAGFSSVNFDLIYGLPTQTTGHWQETLKQSLDLAPPHISLYGLTVEEGTPLWKDVKAGKVPYPDADLAADMYEAAEAALDAAGYQHYEISNWSKPGHECKHNLVYWRNEPFLGVGPGAHSYLGKERFWNLNSPAEYIKRLSHNVGSGEAVPVVEDRTPLTPAAELSETLILRLRLDEGANVHALGSQFGDPAMRLHLATLARFTEGGLLQEQGGVFRLTPRGRLLSNEVFVRLLPA